MDPASLRTLDDFNYTIGAPVEPPRDTVMPMPLSHFEDQQPLVPILPAVHPTSAERDIPVATTTKTGGEQKDAEEEGARPSKKRKPK